MLRGGWIPTQAGWGNRGSLWTWFKSLMIPPAPRRVGLFRNTSHSNRRLAWCPPACKKKEKKSFCFNHEQQLKRRRWSSLASSFGSELAQVSRRLRRPRFMNSLRVDVDHSETNYRGWVRGSWGGAHEFIVWRLVAAVLAETFSTWCGSWVKTADCCHAGCLWSQEVKAKRCFPWE